MADVARGETGGLESAATPKGCRVAGETAVEPPTGITIVLAASGASSGGHPIVDVGAS
jgi:hypothetical protein